MLLPLIIAATTASAQDTTTTIPKRIDFDISAAHYYQADGWGEGAFISGHPAVRAATRWGSNPVIVTDNPLYHGATFAKLHGLVTFIDGVTLDAEIVAEHRGISYGVYATDEMILYPRLLLGIDSTFSIAGEPILVIARVGNHTNLRWYEGLSFYNMDGQGAHLELAWKSLHIWRRQIGDAAAGLGLGIGDVAEGGAGLLDVPLIDSLSTDFRVGYIGYAGSGVDNDEGFEYSLGLQWGTLGRIYGELGTRNVALGSFSPESSAFVVGANGAYALGPIELKGRMEWRNYGEAFNRGRIGDVPFRRVGSTIGPYLYPLDFLERPFSQWAVFTEYQSAITGMTIQLDARLHLPWDFVLRAVLDFNELHAENWSVDSYGFFDIGVGWEPFAGLSTMVSFTNRAMNLDRSYPTYYLYDEPVMAMTMRWNVR